jgi:hypothetical protein
MIELTVITLVVLAVLFVAMGPKPAEPPKEEAADKPDQAAPKAPGPG